MNTGKRSERGIARSAEAHQPADLPPVSLIVCSRNRPALLAETVRSILKGDEVPAELVVVDQSSALNGALAGLRTDRPCDIRYLWTRSVGLSRARNTDIAAARHDVLAFTDDDMIVERTWFGTLVRTLLAAGVRAVVTGRVLAAPGGVPDGFAPSTKADEAPAVHAGRVDTDVLYPNNMALHRAAFTEVGPFDERLGAGTRFPSSEDNDLGFRLLEAGYRILYTPEAVLYHRAWRTAREYLPLRWHYGLGQGAYYAKHLRLTDPYMLQRFRATTVGHVRKIVARTRREPRRAAGDLLFVLGMYWGAALWLATQRRLCGGGQPLLRRQGDVGDGMGRRVW